MAKKKKQKRTVLIDDEDVDQSPSPSSPRPTITWDEAFLEIAVTMTKRSKHPRTQIAALIVNSDNRQIGSGYNGLPAGFPDDSADWSPGMTWTNRDWTIHAEENALLQVGLDKARGATMYVTGAPCPRCLLRIIQCRISRLVFGAAAYSKMGDDQPLFDRLVELAGGKMVPHKELADVFVVKFKPEV